MAGSLFLMSSNDWMPFCLWWFFKPDEGPLGETVACIPRRLESWSNYGPWQKRRFQQFAASNANFLIYVITTVDPVGLRKNFDLKLQFELRKNLLSPLLSLTSLPQSFSVHSPNHQSTARSTPHSFAQEAHLLFSDSTFTLGFFKMHITGEVYELLKKITITLLQYTLAYIANVCLYPQFSLIINKY